MSIHFDENSQLSDLLSPFGSPASAKKPVSEANSPSESTPVLRRKKLKAVKSAPNCHKISVKKNPDGTIPDDVMERAYELWKKQEEKKKAAREKNPKPDKSALTDEEKKKKIAEQRRQKTLTAKARRQVMAEALAEYARMHPEKNIGYKRRAHNSVTTVSGEESGSETEEGSRKEIPETENTP